MNIDVKTVPHGRQRYDTVGDWFYDGEVLSIRASDLGDWRMEFAVIVHELVEAALCRVARITQQQVDEFDFASDSEEPGNEPDSPYNRQHALATAVEYIVLAYLGVSCAEYEERCQNPIPDSTLLARPATAPVLPSG